MRHVLDELRYFEQLSVEILLGLWWIGTGLTSTFPFHSAGNISAGLSESACYCIISSYTPIVKAMQYAQGCTSTTTSILFDHDCWRALVVTMPKTLYMDDLPGTKEERDERIASKGSSVSI